MAEIENAIRKYENAEQEAEETICEKNKTNNRSKWDKRATVVAIFMVIMFTAINNLGLCMPYERKMKCDFWFYLADVFTIVANWEIILHTGYLIKWEKSIFYCVVTRMLELVVAVGGAFIYRICPDSKELCNNILSAIALAYTFLCNY